MYLGQWDVSLDRIWQTGLTEVHIMQKNHSSQLFRGENSFIHSDGCSNQSNHTIFILNGNSDSAGCVRGGREEYANSLSFFIYICCSFL